MEQPTDSSTANKRHRRGFLFVMALLFVVISPHASAQIQNTQTPPENPRADQKATFDRAVEMFDRKNYSVALRAFLDVAGALEARNPEAPTPGTAAANAQRLRTLESIEAASYLGVMYSGGLGTAVDYQESLRWFRKAADAGDPQAMCNVGSLYFAGLGIPKRYDEAIRWFNRCAMEGNLQGMFNLGVMYRDGLGIDKSYERAMIWFQKSADGGNDSAMNAIGGLYEHGRGVTKDLSQAFTWYMKAAEAGNKNAMYNVGAMYESGSGVRKDEAEAKKWFTKSAMRE
jgi:TPR repeat protein